MPLRRRGPHQMGYEQAADYLGVREQEMDAIIRASGGRIAVGFDPEGEFLFAADEHDDARR